MNNLQKGLVGLLVSASSLISGCIYQRQGDTAISALLIPTVVTVERFEDETSNVVIEKEETSVSTFFGNIDVVQKKWERGKYLGKTKTMIRDAFNNPRTIVEEYDEKDRLRDSSKESSGRGVPPSVRSRINYAPD